MYQKILNTIKKKRDKTILDNILHFIENYLPQKKKKSSHSESYLDKFESLTIKKIKKLVSGHSQSIGKDLKITFTFGNWALPYLNLLKRIKLLK